MPGTAALEVEDLRTEFRIGGTWHAAVRGVSFSLARDETLALVGEIGCGKSVTALSIMGLVPPPLGRVAGGQHRAGRAGARRPAASRSWRSCAATGWR